ncbi:acetylxylan esterase [Clostridium chauvoei]|uniref:Acetyl xylan esterase domain-containing protein n=2 Tax=Clostridium chauvoei TaxID=46867 RepID=A0A1U6J2P6_9CLOT|nr:acetylxylan esterase [Clostridium chauvoei]MBX7281645.1 acetylxylan esterase [Clostridium chauvoei]MBX7284165.1 acetylxylan esterase [Clostridium chauvoei]MBX7286693.1 acetylxylan esterase [Clostridium chauvoei]MBX7289213.1 acetylxylan esterase [Clostridium chauvoei]MBX7291728.1 acetylxylan esterase [Clostridium chauvoei]
MPMIDMSLEKLKEYRGISPKPDDINNHGQN